MDNMMKLKNKKIVTIAGKEYPLRIVTEEQLFKLRMSGKPGFIMKMDYQLWYTEIPANASLRAEKWFVHKCCAGHSCCQRVSTLKDPEGCACIRDRSPLAYGRKYYTKKQAYLCSMRIEKYSFITFACETFNTVEEGLKIMECSNYVVPKKRRYNNENLDQYANEYNARQKTTEEAMESLKEFISENHIWF